MIITGYYIEASQTITIWTVFYLAT